MYSCRLGLLSMEELHTTAVYTYLYSGFCLLAGRFVGRLNNKSWGSDLTMQRSVCLSSHLTVLSTQLPQYYTQCHVLNPYAAEILNML